MKSRSHNRQHLISSISIMVVASSANNFCFAQESVIELDAQTINYSIDREMQPFAPAGLIRFLEDPKAEGGISLPAANSAPGTDAIGGKAASPGYSETSNAPIALAPLTTPNTVTAGIGTGAMPQDMVAGRLPQPINLPTGSTRENPPIATTKAWVPGGFCHQPLYWENPMLERHGHQTHPMLQPVISGTRFYGTFLVLPYLATLRDPLDDVHTLGSYRPGSPAPALRYRAHYDPRALRNQVIMSGAATALSAP